MKTLIPAAALIALLATTAAAAPVAAQGASAERAFDATTLNLTAEGEVKAAPDNATITVGVQTKAATAAQAMTGYQAANDVTIRVVDLKRLGASLDAVVTAGANQINGISFGLKDPAAAEDAARRAAVAALRAKADLYAQATGYHVARLVNLSEGGGYAPAPMRAMNFARNSVGAEPTPVSAGELTVRINVTGVYELAR
jgi:hypothetical protein